MAVVGIYSLLLARNKILLIRVFESNTVNNMKLMILEKIRVIHTCSSSPRAASVWFLCTSVQYPFMISLCVCSVFWFRGSGAITQYQSLPLAPRKVLPVCVTQ